MKYTLTLLLCLCLFHTVYAQQIRQSIAEFEASTSAKVSIEESTDMIQFIRFPHDEPMELSGNSLTEKVNNFLTQPARKLFPNAEELLVFKALKTDAYGFRHLHYEGIYQGVPIFANDLRFHFDANNRLTAVNGILFSDVDINILPDLTSEEANNIALNQIEQQTNGNYSAPLNVHKTTLYIFKDKFVQNIDGNIHLVYEVEIRNNAEIREFFYIDAHSGKLVEQFTGHCGALERRLYDGDVNNQIWEEGDAFPGSLNSEEQTVLEAAEHTYYLFENAFGYTSYNGSDAMMRSVNSISGNCPNAFWNGSTTNYCDGVNSDDVVGHEWGHAYTEYTSGLIYQWQSGALNESYSDIWGEMVDLLNAYNDSDEDLSLRTSCSSSDRWMMGEDASGFSSPIRDMWDPTCKGDPGKVTDSEYHCATSDGGGVHSNSGVNNHGFALLVDGGTYNGQIISALGFTKAAHIFWRAQHIYLTNASDFNNQADALEAACADLVGIDLEGFSFNSTPAGPSGEVITVADCQEVFDMVLAVEFRTEPDCDFEPILEQPIQALCDAGFGAEMIFEDDFETGLDGWTITQHPENPDDWDDREWIIDTSLPDGRAGSAVFGPDPIPAGNCSTDLDNGIIRMESPVITIPAEAIETVEMAFEHYVAMETNWDGGNIKYSLNGGAWTIIPVTAFTFNAYNGTLNGGGNDNPMASEAAFTGSDEGSVSGSWGQSIIDLGSLGAAALDEIQLRFELGSDGCNGLDGWYIDDLKIYHCVAGLPVELMFFTAKENGSKAVLNWATASEENSMGFQIERSKNGQSWEKIGFVESALVNSAGRKDYHFVDSRPISGTSYYRLKQLDFDGEFEYSNIRSVRFGSNGKEDLVIRPNPFNNKLTLEIPATASENVSVEIFDITGRRVWFEQSFVLDRTIFLNDLSTIPEGVYCLKVSSSAGVFTAKMVREVQ